MAQERDIKYGDVAHCLRCNQRRMVPRYPGNNPENGPAIKWCSKCDLEVEPCSYCELCFHERMLPTPGQTWLHNSWGHGDPEAMKIEPVEIDINVEDDAAAMEAEWQRRRLAGLCMTCGEVGTHVFIVDGDGTTDKYCNVHWNEFIDEQVRHAERCAGWDPSP